MRIDIRFQSGQESEAARDWTERRVRFALNQFGPAVRGVAVRITDENGPKGGADQRCLMEARFARGGAVVAEVRDTDLYAAVSRAADRLRRVVTTALDRRREERRQWERDNPEGAAA